jgi:dihydroxyacetone kinase DhaKLM complex PTS-EIIA-like component DhaM
MAIEMQPKKHRSTIVVRNGPINEGAIMVVTELRSDWKLDRAHHAAEELSS